MVTDAVPFDASHVDPALRQPPQRRRPEAAETDNHDILRDNLHSRTPYGASNRSRTDGTPVSEPSAAKRAPAALANAPASSASSRGARTTSSGSSRAAATGSSSVSPAVRQQQHHPPRRPGRGQRTGRGRSASARCVTPCPRSASTRSTTLAAGSVPCSATHVRTSRANASTACSLGRPRARTRRSRSPPRRAARRSSSRRRRPPGTARARAWPQSRAVSSSSRAGGARPGRVDDRVHRRVDVEVAAAVGRHAAAAARCPARARPARVATGRGSRPRREPPCACARSRSSVACVMSASSARVASGSSASAASQRVLVERADLGRDLGEAARACASCGAADRAGARCVALRGRAAAVVRPPPAAGSGFPRRTARPPSARSSSGRRLGAEHRLVELAHDRPRACGRTTRAAGSARTARRARRPARRASRRRRPPRSPASRRRSRTRSIAPRTDEPIRTSGCVAGAADQLDDLGPPGRVRRPARAARRSPPRSAADW